MGAPQHIASTLLPQVQALTALQRIRRILSSAAACSTHARQHQPTPTVAKVWRLVLRAGAPVLQQLLIRQLGQVCNLPQHMRQRPPLPQHQPHLPRRSAVDAAQWAAAGAAIPVVAAICAAAAAVSSQGIDPLAHAGRQQGSPLAGRWRCWICCERPQIQGQCCGAGAAVCSCIQCADAA